jgi:hypothetical protein
MKTPIKLHGDWFTVRGLLMLSSTLPTDIQEAKELSGLTVDVEGELYTVQGMELFMHAPPWKKGEACSFSLQLLSEEQSLAWRTFYTDRSNLELEPL